MSTEFFYPQKETIIPDHKETARYLGYNKLISPDEKISHLIEQAAQMMHPLLVPKTVYEQFDLKIIPSKNNEQKHCINFADTSIFSNDLARNLEPCSSVYLFAATLGPQVDSLIRKTQITDTVLASILQATGAMYIEKVVDSLNDRIAEFAASSGKKTRPRFSPGFGDVPLQVQKEFFRLLPCTKIGLTLMDTLIMAPEKSVTAFVGVY